MRKFFFFVPDIHVAKIAIYIYVMFGEKSNLKSFNDYEILEKKYFGEESINNLRRYNPINHKSYNFLACDWFKNVLFSTNSLAKLLSDSLLLDSLLSDSLIRQSHSKM